MLTPFNRLHLSGPLCQPRNLLFRYATEQIQATENVGSPCTFGKSRHKRQKDPLYELDAHPCLVPIRAMHLIVMFRVF